MRMLSAVLSIVVTSFAHAEGTTIYRCSDGQGGVLYANIPCAGGVALDIPQTKVDHAAQERLRHEQEAFDKRQASRDAAFAQAAARRDDERRRADEERRQRDDAQRAYVSSYPWFYAPMYEPPLRRPPSRRAPERSRSFVPAR